ncbi:MAG: phosphoribosylglycinamide formyltransferase [Pseudomonadota bacterium]|jgi:phosphoribosylglycinamide formyltransferase-1
MEPVNKRLLVLLSGRGSNFLALSDWLERHPCAMEISCVASNRPEARGLVLARERGLRTACWDTKQPGGMPAFEAALEQELAQHPVDLIVLAGFMRILSPEFCLRHVGRILNIHPSLLPAFTGLNTHARALEAGVRVHGATVHLVSPELDAGHILAQGVVPVLPGDTPDTLSARVLELEHRLYPQAIAAVAAGLMRASPSGWQKGTAYPGFESLEFSPCLLHPAWGDLQRPASPRDGT